MPDWQTLPSADLALSMAATPDVVRKARPAAGATADIGVTIVVRKSSVSNTASVSSGTPDPNPSNDTVTIVTPVK